MPLTEGSGGHLLIMSMAAASPWEVGTGTLSAPELRGRDRGTEHRSCRARVSGWVGTGDRSRRGCGTGPLPGPLLTPDGCGSGQAPPRSPPETLRGAARLGWSTPGPSARGRAARTSPSAGARLSLGPCGPGRPRAAPEDGELVGALQAQHRHLCRETPSDSDRQHADLGLRAPR